MTEEIKAFLSNYLPGENLEPFATRFHKSEVKKGRHLLNPGQDCSYLAFIQHGCFKAYYVDDKDKEIITWFSFQNQVITDLLNFYRGGNSQFYIQAIEDCEVYKISKSDLEMLYKEHPEYLNFARRFAEEAATILMDRMLSLQTKSAEDRYRELLETPHFLQKIPLKDLASFLGVTDTSLSRIRRTIV